MRRGIALSSPAAFWAASGVLVLSLWASGSPAMLYPVLASQWNEPPVTTTALFAVYPLALVVVMVLCGSLSDRYGRRPLLVTGVAIVAVGSLLFSATEPIAVVFAGRALQGAGVGLAMSAASAAIVEYNPRPAASRASAVNTAATAVGAAIAILLGGFLAQYTPQPVHVMFLMLLVATVVLAGTLLFFPAPAPAKAVFSPRGRRPLLLIPAVQRESFVVGTASVTVAFITGAVFLALGAQVLHELVGTTNAFVAAAALATWPVIIVPTTLAAQRFAPRVSTTIGGSIAAAGILLLLLSGITDSLALFLASALTSGTGYGLLVYGGLGLVTSSTIPTERAGTFSAMYLSAYLSQGATAVLIGLLATTAGLDTAIAVSAPVIAVLCVAIAITAARR